MSLQIKKPLSAQAVGTDMYKMEKVIQIKLATKQPERSGVQKSTILLWRRRRKKNNENMWQFTSPTPEMSIRTDHHQTSF